MKVFLCTAFLLSWSNFAVAKWSELNNHLSIFESEDKAKGSIYALKLKKSSFLAEIVATSKYNSIAAKNPIIPNSLKEVKDRNLKAIAIINGGFSSHLEYPIPVGALHIKGKTVSKPNLTATVFNQVFCIKKNRQVDILPVSIGTKNCESFVQAGPELINDGTAQTLTDKFKDQKAERSAICIRENGDFILIKTEQMLFSRLQEILLEPEFSCLKAMALSGGNQSGLIIHNAGKFHIFGNTKTVIPSAIVVHLPKE